jgi:hypothetical protein
MGIFEWEIPPFEESNLGFFSPPKIEFQRRKKVKNC